MKYLIFGIHGPDVLRDFDPVNDLLVHKEFFLTWRRHDQDLRLANSNLRVLYGIHGRGAHGRWFVEPFDDSQEAVSHLDGWLDCQAVDPAHGRMGQWKASLYRGLLAKSAAGDAMDQTLQSLAERNLPELIEFHSQFFGEHDHRVETALLTRRSPLLQWEWLHTHLVEDLIDCRGGLAA